MEWRIGTLSISLITGLVTFVIGAAYTGLSLSLPAAAIGRSFEPKIFPVMLGIIMIILSISLIGQELKKKNSSKEGYIKVFFVFDNHMKNIAYTVLNAILYSFLFSKAGYVVSTFIFIGLELVLFNGIKKWKSTVVIALIFSLSVYIMFNKILGVYLPYTPYLGL